ncbi:MAG: SDR family NAD(P)-dependent oxidoreductase [Candidatus Dadabacteria bacterium]|nr:SDR family NAD(P)-dependent oxidoreductase [Candidatus Dadabacteria bacterium]MYC40421.1 SDR family NAD(P)-dependent oxidoreductase [Candidatus Dadabacteria bacterium]
MTKSNKSCDSSGESLPNSETQKQEKSGFGPPIAIVGMGCRFPGASSIPAFWRLLESGQNTVTEGVPGSGVGRMDELFPDGQIPSNACRFCGYVDGIEQFDAGFFRISPVEAQLLDPQQRMMLETTWEALEDAGMDPDRLKGSRTGVYTGISNDEYRMLVVESRKPAEAASCLYALSGTNLNGTSGRVSFVLGLMGPAKAVDAACASSMVSVHDAVADLQQGKADLAIAGGVQAILNSRIFELRADAMMLSPDGQCKTFDASANGYVRGEGCGVVILKRLSEAEEDGDRIWGVIRGSAVNNGGPGTGLTVPHTPALEQVMEAALSQAGVTASDVDYIEAHGTGTAVGDPIEIEAVSAVYGKGRKADRPLLIGSVKTNIGHLESAAGIAGLIKAVLVMQRGVIPKHLHFQVPNPALDWDRLPLKVTSSIMDLPERGGRPRLAGVNSFGISGTNAHIVVEEYIARGTSPYRKHELAGSAQAVTVSLPEAVESLSPPEQELKRRETRLLPLSGKSVSALRELAERYLSWLDERPEDIASQSASAEPLLSDMAWTAGVGRSHFDHRAGVVFRDAGSLREGLKALGDSGESPGPQTPTKVAFAYTGQGSQWAGMGKALYEREPVARAVLDRCEEAFRDERGTSLLDVMFGGGEGDLGDTAWEQPALYALECALTALWSSVGVRPSVVLGHSVGELAAAQAAGVFSLEDGMRFAAARGTLLSETEPGAMAAVFATPARVTSTVEEINESSASVGLSISADNGGHQVVSGPVADIETISKRFKSEGVRVRRLNTTRAFHSALVEPALDMLEASLDSAAIEPPSLTVVSNLTGQTVEPGQALDGAYWRQHAREKVAFASGVRTLAEFGVDLVLEIGPRPILASMTVSAWPDSAQTPAPTVLSSLRPPSGESSASVDDADFTRAVAEAYQAGLPIRFEGLFAGESRRRISLPSYPFQRERHWLDSKRKQRSGVGHPLLGVRHESASGQVTFETEVFQSDPEWLSDHRVFGRVIAPGALYGAMAASASLTEESGAVVVEDMQLLNALIFPEEGSEDGTGDEGREVQVVLDSSERANSRRVQIFSKGSGEDWTAHVEGHISSGAPIPEAGGRIDLESLKAPLSPIDVAAYYRARADTGINLGPFFRTLENAWSGPGEALGEISFPEALGRNELDVHPLLLDGCFQVVAAARNPGGVEEETTYLPFGWERLWLADRLPDRLFCHVRMSEVSQGTEAEQDEPPEVWNGELRIYDPNGVLLGGLNGYMVKRATRAALLSAGEGVNELLYEVVWREKALTPGMLPADFLASQATIVARSGLLSDYLADEGVTPKDRSALLTDLERWSRSCALETLEKLGWEREVGVAVDSEDLRQRLNVVEEHKKLFRRTLEMLAKSGVLEEVDGDFVVRIGPGDPLPDEMPPDTEEFAARMAELYPHGLTEIGLFRRSGNALADVLLGQADPLTVLFSSGDPTPGDLYLKAPVARAANRLLRETVQTLVAGLPDGRHLRVIEVGAGTGSATAAILPELPEGRFDYMYTDISAGFFAEAEARFGGEEASIDYRMLDIEKDPVEQGFDSHGYDLVIASNVLHATRYLDETLGHCRRLLAPSGQMVALENLRGMGWMDLTFGPLDGWWRFADAYRPQHALVEPAVWRRVLADVGFEEIEVLGVKESDSTEMPDKGVIVARGPAEVTEKPGVWVLAADSADVAEELAAGLAARNQTVVLADHQPPENGHSEVDGSGILRSTVEMERRESWQSLLESLPGDTPLSGVVHLVALGGHGPNATTEEMAEDTRRAVASALALTQGLLDSDVAPENGVWFLTRGAQVLEKELGGELAGATLWGFGKGVSREAAHLKLRMIDLDPVETQSPELLDELLYPDHENHIAHRYGRRMVARLVRAGTSTERLTFPEQSAWALAPDPDGIFDKPYVKPLPARSLEPKEVRIAVRAAGMNFWDVFRSLGFIEEENLGKEMCGHVLDVGSEVSTVSVGDHVVGLGFGGAFAAETIIREELVVPAPPGIPATGLATVPNVYVSAAFSYELSGLNAGDRVLIHAGAGGVGLAAIQLAHAAGAEVYATASELKRPYLRSIGVEHVFDSRTTKFGEEILEATDGAGVDVVLNSLTGEGFIEASLSCLAQGGRFVELARRDILSEEEMAEVRPDVAYSILELDVLKKTEPACVGRVFQEVMERIAAGELKPLIHSSWPLAEAGAALRFMRSGRHIGKIVLTNSPLQTGRLREDRTYLVTGGLGGIGCAVAGWLADHGAGTIVLNGRRSPDPEVEKEIDSLRERGFTVRVELADVTDTAAVDDMLGRMDRELPPLGGVIHSVGVLSDASLSNQSWESFEQVLWPKVLGAWHLHRATAERDLEFFILFSSRVGVMGNPGQSNHAAANAFLDQLAAHRRAVGLPGQAIAWGAWSEIGEAAEQRDRIERQRSALGGRWFTPQQGLRAFDRLVRQDVTNSVVMSMDWEVFEEAVEDRPSLLEDLISTSLKADTDSPAQTDDLMSRVRKTTVAEREGMLVSFLQGEVQAVLRLPSTPTPTVGFFDLGMDSLMAVELRNRLNRAFAGEYVVSNTAVFDYPDITTLARYLGDELGQLGGDDGTSQTPETATPAPRAPVSTENDDIAIVGMACRFPGAKNLSEYWHLLESGTDAVTDGRQAGDSPRNAFGDSNSESTTHLHGAFVEDIEWFDSRFFRIAPIEARMMDPRQRMMLETSWEAIEDAGIAPDSLRGSRTGVYAGISHSEYQHVIEETQGKADTFLGLMASVTAGRVASALGLEGPAMAIDMACASALAAVHQAVAGLRRGDVDLALAGGVHAALSRNISKLMLDVGMLSPSGQCHPFDASADGYVRGEGCGMLILKRLGEAQIDGDRIWGVIKGSAVNQNGASAGFTIPNGPAQERVIEEALAQAGLTGRDVDYLEAHATASQLGDAIEVHAAGSVYGRGRDADRPLLIGTVKSNIGYLETAAGVAGLIKAVLAMKQGVIPKHLHFKEPNPQIDWDRLAVRVTSEKTDWPPHPDRPPRAAVSAFGISGANAHMVVEGYGIATENGSGSAGVQSLRGAAQQVPISLPEPVANLPLVMDGLMERTVRFLPLSGKSDGALRDIAKQYLSWFDEHIAESSPKAPALADIAWTAGVGRSHFDHRAAVVFGDMQSLRAGLTKLAETGATPDKPDPQPLNKVAFVYTGEGSQWVGMGETLYNSEPVVRAVLNHCDAVVRAERGASLLDVMFGRTEATDDLNDADWAQPALYALECALTALWASVGIRPTAALGHGTGEIAAAQAAGVFTLEEGLRFALTRGTLMAALPGVDPDQSLNGLEAAFAESAVSPPSLTLVSGVTGRVVDADSPLDGAYWRTQACETTAFGAGVSALAELGVDAVVEIGPGAVLGPQVSLEWPDSSDGEEATTSPLVLVSLMRPSDEDSEEDGTGFAKAVAGAYEAGLALSFEGMFAGESRRRISLPSYPFQRRRHWV